MSFVPAIAYQVSLEIILVWISLPSLLFLENYL